MLRKLLAGAVFAIFLSGASGLVFAQGEPPKVTYKKKTIYDFDDDLVEGELQRPDGEYIDTRRKAKHSSLIKIREHFIPEMLKSAEDI
ncbi:MAG: adventurous gliding motility protein CglF [Deltaproteobacteria bacterium]|nr:adventurous gliding motility protein CglF [Deltaproteobacteria bacterium]